MTFAHSAIRSLQASRSSSIEVDVSKSSRQNIISTNSNIPLETVFQSNTVNKTPCRLHYSVFCVVFFCYLRINFFSLLYIVLNTILLTGVSRNGGNMNDKGYLTVQVYTARMAIPLRDISVTITENTSGTTKLIAHRTTDQNGKTIPIELQTPTSLYSTEPSNNIPFTSCNVQIDHPLYTSVRIDNVQIFPGKESLQQTELMPLPDFATEDSKSSLFIITPQDL